MSDHETHPSSCLTDLSGRRLSYLRISLTDRCNLRCDYCYHSVNESQIAERELSDDEVIRLVRVFSKMGFDKIRFTGGELLLRDRVVDLIRETAVTAGVSLIGITTNGLLLEKHLPGLIDAGLNRLNVSLDTLDREKFKRITGVDGLDRVTSVISRALETNVFPRVKINTLVMRGVNDDEIDKLADWGLSRRTDLRFIEFMPTRGSGWEESRFVSQDEMIERVRGPLDIDPVIEPNSGPALTFKQRGRPGRVSFISAVSRSFCNECNRLRVTSRGTVVGCLFSGKEIRIRELLDPRVDDETIIAVIKTLTRSQDFRRGIENRTRTWEGPSMRGIGG
ncbi:MAG: GTP 3',8-cyclase MoaA [Candidatus Latescibacterota bacterium]|nr:MAG: GTP 3',8-cyclase MoaA [Candidatus Latescibacterota bacterium]